MKIVLLTTKTLHHLYFIGVIKKKFSKIFTILENKKIKYQFKTKHEFEIKRNKFEKKKFFKNKKYNLKNFKSFKDINNKKTLNYIKKINPDVIISFGVGLIKKNFLNTFKNKKIINLHGGNPEEYRGLDSILWSMYHKDFKNLYTTLHFVDPKFDSGKIIFKKKIKFLKSTKFEEIRSINTINCNKLVIQYLNYLKRGKKILALKQKKKGRYYSAIPANLIDTCIVNFNNYINKIKRL